MRYELHPLCTLFPRLEGSEFQALCNDIRENGLRNPIVLHNGMILDGGNRYRACIESGIEPIFQEFTEGNLVSFVLSANLHRRHMSPGQQAAIVASAQDWAKAQTVGNPSFKITEQKCNVAPLETVADRAAQSGASVRTQKMADKVAKANPELAKRVAHGEISLPKAVETVTPQFAQNRKPARPAPAPAIPEGMVLYSKDEFEENIRLMNDANKDLESIVKVFESDDRLAAATAEIKRLNALITVLEDRNRGMMNECNEAKRLARSWKNRYEKLERECKAAGLVDF